MWLTCRADAFQSGGLGSLTLEQRVARENQLIRAGERSGLDPLNLGRLWGHLASDYEDEAEFEKAEAAYNHALQLFEHLPAGAKDYVVALGNLGSLYLLTHRNDEAMRCRKRALAAREAMGDKLEIARGKELLAEVYLAEHKYKEARQTAEEAYDSMVALKDSNSSELVATLITLTYSSCMRGQCAYAVDRGREAKSLALSAPEADSLPLGEARMALGYAEWKAGMKDDPDAEMREGIRILRRWMTPGHPYVLGAMRQYSKYLNETHRTVEAKEVAEEEKRMNTAQQYTCANCTVSVYGLRVR
ncbi:tetratricopeptide repeat protein [Edaphobacter bradus]|uniref:tetratricopeptide repeat protein n=1 Tax=Edaphobacter bradus TaxID=2259016 RepID=UPI0021E0F0A3|nr:tetratricopeptide repeat protein [Edaphobacter bradus]